MLNKDDEREGFGKADVVSNASALVLTSAFSVVGDVVEWVNTDNVEIAIAILTFTPSAITTSLDKINLHASKNLVDGVNSEIFPLAGSTAIGTFDIMPSAAEQTVTAEIQLDNCKSGQSYLFAIENLLTTVSVNAGWTLTITPKAKGTN